MRSKIWTPLALAGAVLMGLAAVSLNAGEKQGLPPLEGFGVQCGLTAGAATGTLELCGSGQCSGGACPKHDGRCVEVKGRLEKALADLDAAVAAASQAVKDGNTDEALARLERAKELIAGTREQVKTACEPKPAAAAAGGPPVNARCPILGSPIDPAKVPAHLTRPFEGRTVGFCCNGCPQAWDKLTPEQRRDRLRAATDVPADR